MNINSDNYYIYTGSYIIRYIPITCTIGYRLLLTIMVSTWVLGVLATGPAAAALVTPLVSQLCTELEQIEEESAVAEEIRQRRTKGG